MKKCFSIFFLSVMMLNSYSQVNPILKIGLIADPQYENADNSGKRHYRESLWKLKAAVDSFNYFKVDFVQNFGDIINRGKASFDSILPIYAALNPEIENFHLLGNHDFAVEPEFKKDILKFLSMPDFYYSYVKNNWRFVVLDATDCSYFSNSQHNYDPKVIDAYYEKTASRPNHFNWNAAIGEKQQEWLRNEIRIAEESDQRVIIFSHIPVKPLNTPENLWNDQEIAEIIEKSPNVKAFINGHRHSGNFAFENGVYYITLLGMVEALPNAFSILEIFKDKLVLRGFGSQESYTLELNINH